MLAIAPSANRRLATRSEVFPDWMPAVRPRRSPSDATFKLPGVNVSAIDCDDPLIAARSCGGYRGREPQPNHERKVSRRRWGYSAACAADADKCGRRARVAAIAGRAGPA